MKKQKIILAVAVSLIVLSGVAILKPGWPKVLAQSVNSGWTIFNTQNSGYFFENQTSNNAIALDLSQGSSNIMTTARIFPYYGGVMVGIGNNDWSQTGMTGIWLVSPSVANGHTYPGYVNTYYYDPNLYGVGRGGWVPIGLNTNTTNASVYQEGALAGYCAKVVRRYGAGGSNNYSYQTTSTLPATTINGGYAGGFTSYCGCENGFTPVALSGVPLDSTPESGNGSCIKN